MKIQCWAILAAMMTLAVTRGALAQVPFYSSQATSADPVIAVALDGVMLNVQRATVSADHKYVTIDTHAQLNSFGGFKTFTFQKPGLGFVGSATATGAAAAKSTASASRNGLTPSLATSPAAIAAAAAPASILDRRGMTLISPIQP